MPEGGPSIREAISSAMKSDSSGGSQVASDSGGAVSPPQAPASTADTSGASQASQVQSSTLGGSEIPMGQDIGVQGKGPTRDPNGKFAPKTAADPAIAPVSAAVAKTPDPTTKAPDGGAQPPILPPSTWGKDAKVEWSTLPRSAQVEIERREKDRDRALHQERARINTVMQRYTALDQVIGPRRQAFAAQGLDEARAVAQLFALSDSANANPAGFIQWFAQQRGVDIASLVAGSSQQAPVDPTIQALQDQLARQGKVISELGNTFRGTAEARESESQNAMLQTIDRWSEEKEADGSLKRPYFERLETEVLTILPLITKEMPTASPTERLEAAYDRAVYLHPETRQAVTQMAQAKKDAEARAAATKAAEAARMAGTSIGGGTVASAGRVPPKTVGAALRQAVAEAKGRAA